MSKFGKSSLLLLIAIVLVGLNLRPALASIGPLLDAIQRAIGLTDTRASLLTTIPVFLMGACALSAYRLRRLTGERYGILLGIAVIGLACAGRAGVSTGAGLVGTAVAAGIGIAIVQALLPAFIRRCFAERAGGVMGYYSTAIMGGAVSASVLSPRLASHFGWVAALASWCLPALLAAGAWMLATRGAGHSVVITEATRTPFSRSPRAWLLALFFGLGTGAYTLVLAWLPPYYTGLGWAPVDAGELLGVVTLAEVVAGLAVSFWIDRLPDRRPALLSAILSLFVGLLCLLITPLQLALPSAILMGLGIGALFPLSLIVAMDHASDPRQAGELAAFVQGSGYLIAATFPFIAGVLRQHMASLSLAWVLMAGLSLVLVGIALRFSPASYARMSG
ncbi:MFS transporter [Archangium lipolyticum]|uniref:MFS transporter n=1 Tax=Archangium lipolyticum TaxID=2970465 RepID=UPI00214A820E|nr:MFS transporter [Archangium lipolyticum]